MTTFRTLEDFYVKRGIARSIDDILAKRKDKRFVNKIKWQLKQHEHLLLLMPTQKLQKVITAKYKQERLKNLGKKVSDVQTLRKLKKEKKESERIIDLFDNTLKQYSEQMKKILQDYKKCKKQLERYVKKAREYEKKYNSAVKTYNRLLERWKYKIRIKDEFAFYKVLQGQKKIVSEYRRRYLNYTGKLKDLEKKMTQLNKEYLSLSQKVKKVWEKI